MNEKTLSNDIQVIRTELLRKMGRNSEAYPAQIEQKFPRLLARIADQWGTPALDGFLEELMLCDRDDRQGFPPEVATEIFNLLSVHGALGFAPQKNDQGWAGIEDVRIDMKANVKDR